MAANRQIVTTRRRARGGCREETLRSTGGHKLTQCGIQWRSGGDAFDAMQRPSRVCFGWAIPRFAEERHARLIRSPCERLVTGAWHVTTLAHIAEIFLRSTNPETATTRQAARTACVS